MKELESQLQSVLNEVQQYNEKPNKALSKRIRVKLGSLKKDVTGYRTQLVEADKVGY